MRIRAGLARDGRRFHRAPDDVPTNRSSRCRRGGARRTPCRRARGRPRDDGAQSATGAQFTHPTTPAPTLRPCASSDRAGDAPDRARSLDDDAQTYFLVDVFVARRCSRCLRKVRSERDFSFPRGASPTRRPSRTNFPVQRRARGRRAFPCTRAQSARTSCAPVASHSPYLPLDLCSRAPRHTGRRRPLRLSGGSTCSSRTPSPPSPPRARGAMLSANACSPRWRARLIACSSPAPSDGALSRAARMLHATPTLCAPRARRAPAHIALCFARNSEGFGKNGKWEIIII